MEQAREKLHDAMREKTSQHAKISYEKQVLQIRVEKLREAYGMQS
jgi:hypothetical protein